MLNNRKVFAKFWINSIRSRLTGAWTYWRGTRWWGSGWVITKWWCQHGWVPHYQVIPFYKMKYVVPGPSYGPYVAFAVHRSSGRAHTPWECDWRWTKRNVRSLKVTIELKLLFNREDELPTIMQESYSDTDYSANRTDRKSFSGGVIYHNAMIAEWMCRKQVSVLYARLRPSPWQFRWWQKIC